MLGRLLITGLLAAAMGGVAALLLWPGSIGRLIPQFQKSASHQPRTLTTGTAKVGAPFTLTAHTGERISSRRFKDRYMLVFFGYTHASHTTSAALQLITDTLDRLGPKARDFQPVFITIDPERDTPARLAEVFTKAHPRFLALTGTPAELAAVAKSYVVHYRERATEAGAPKAFDVTSLIYVMNRDGTYRAHYTHATPRRDFEDALTALE